jgi:P4 family phage/plasmid primase-like protien
LSFQNDSELKISDLSGEELTEFNEKAAVLEFDRGLSRIYAEQEALEHIRRKRADNLTHEIEFKNAGKILSFRAKSEYTDQFDCYQNLLEKALRETPINSFHPTEDGQMEAAEFYLNGLIRRTDGMGWLAYDFTEGRYRADLAESLLRFCLQRLARERYDLRNSAEDTKEFFRFAEKAVTEPSTRHVEKLLESRPSVFALPADFDQSYYFINCAGETYDLQTGSHISSLPEHLHTKTTGYRPMPGECPIFRKFLDEITLEDTELAEWIMRWFGYKLTGDIRAPFIVNFHGGGRNGKGTLFHVMRQIMGSYAREIDEEIIVDTGKRGNVKNALANLVGIRAGFAADVPAGSLNLADLKRITGGDEIVAERKYHDSFPFRPIVKLTFSSNHMLRLPETGQAMKSRLRYVPFKASFVGREDTGLEDRILKEAPQILDWLIKEAGEYLKNPGPKGFPPCRTIDEATENYIKEEDVIGQFLEERTAEAPYNTIQARALYDEYLQWAGGRGDKRTLSSQAFGRRMTERNLEKEHNRQGWWYKNIKIRGVYE